MMLEYVSAANNSSSKNDNGRRANGNGIIIETLKIRSEVYSIVSMWNLLVDFSEVTECGIDKDLSVLERKLAGMICFLNNHTAKFTDVFIRACSVHNNNCKTEVNSARGQINLTEDLAMVLDCPSKKLFLKSPYILDVEFLNSSAVIDSTLQYFSSGNNIVSLTQIQRKTLEETGNKSDLLENVTFNSPNVEQREEEGRKEAVSFPCSNETLDTNSTMREDVLLSVLGIYSTYSEVTSARANMKLNIKYQNPISISAKFQEKD